VAPIPREPHDPVDVDNIRTPWVNRENRSNRECKCRGRG
jgi:hypothetical protein